MELSKKEKKLILWFVNFAIIICCYCVYIFLQHYSVDSFDTYRNLQNTAMTNLNNGRPINYWIYHIMDLASINLTVNTKLNLILYSAEWCTFLTIIVLKIYDEIGNCTFVGKCCIDIGILLSFINPSVLMCTYYYCEIAIICIVGSIFLHLAVYWCCFGKRRSIDFIICIILLYLSLSVYQIYAGCFIGYVLIIHIAKNNFNLSKKTIKELIGSVIICGTSCGLSILQMNLMQYTGIIGIVNRSATFSIETILSNLIKIIKAQSAIWISGDSLMPNYILIGWIVVSIIFQIKTQHKSLINYLYIVLIALIIWGVVFAPLIISSEMWMAPRTYFGMYTIISLISIVTVNNIKNNYVYQKIYLICSTIIILIFAISLIDIQVNTIVNNKLDQKEIYMIEQCIETYEKESGHYVDTIKYSFDDDRMYGYYNQVKYVLYDNNTRGLATTWCLQSMIPYYLNREYNIVLMLDEERDELFGTNNWNYFDLDEQMIIHDNVAYLMVY